MRNVALDATVLVSAFLTPGGVSDEFLHRGREGAFVVFLTEDILAEVVHTLAYPHIRRRYPYTDADVRIFCESLREAAPLVPISADIPAVVRDPNDDMVLATAHTAHVTYLITHDLDLLSLQSYEGITILTPEAFMAILREQEARRREGNIEAAEQP
jgi:putative PIN family toxin of toxin-antitoxin system